MNDALKAFLIDLRQHPMFPVLLKAMEKPRLPRFRASQADQVEKARAQWIYQSGRFDEHNTWVHFLSGAVPPQGDNEASQQENL